jgi:hypothetical protein
VVFETVFLKEFDSPDEKDTFNLAFLYKAMKDNINAEYNESVKEKYQEIREKGDEM